MLCDLSPLHHPPLKKVSDLGITCMPTSQFVVGEETFTFSNHVNKLFCSKFEILHYTLNLVSVVPGNFANPSTIFNFVPHGTEHINYDIYYDGVFSICGTNPIAITLAVPSTSKTMTISYYVKVLCNGPITNAPLAIVGTPQTTIFSNIVTSVYC